MVKTLTCSPLVILWRHHGQVFMTVSSSWGKSSVICTLSRGYPGVKGVTGFVIVPLYILVRVQVGQDFPHHGSLPPVLLCLGTLAGGHAPAHVPILIMGIMGMIPIRAGHFIGGHVPFRQGPIPPVSRGYFPIGYEFVSHAYGGSAANAHKEMLLIHPRVPCLTSRMPPVHFRPALCPGHPGRDDRLRDLGPERSHPVR